MLISFWFEPVAADMKSCYWVFGKWLGWKLFLKLYHGTRSWDLQCRFSLWMGGMWASQVHKSSATKDTCYDVNQYQHGQQVFQCAGDFLAALDLAEEVLPIQHWCSTLFSLFLQDIAAVAGSSWYCHQPTMQTFAGHHFFHCSVVASTEVSICQEEWIDATESCSH